MRFLLDENVSYRVALVVPDRVIAVERPAPEPAAERDVQSEEISDVLRCLIVGYGQ